jgi:catechol-2,3-dioxygenase
MASAFTELVVDCSDPKRVAHFWAAVLGYEVTDEEDDEIVIRGHGDSPAILFGTVPEPKTVKNRIHIDLTPTDRGQQEEVERILGLGATRVDIGQGRQSWVVLADPEGNEFCVLEARLTSELLTPEQESEEAVVESFPASDAPAW